MKFSYFLIVIAVIILPIFLNAMESQEDSLWQNLTYVYEYQSDTIAQLCNSLETDKATFEKALDEWQALPIAYEILKLRQKNNITPHEVIDFSLYNLGQFLAVQEYTQRT
jgi:hypothetical protein